MRHLLRTRRPPTAPSPAVIPEVHVTSTISDPTRHPDTGRTVAEHLEDLVERLRQVAAEEAGDPSSTALDPAGWQVRATERTQRRLRLESEKRFVAEFRSYAWRHDRALTTYVKAARPIEARSERLVETWLFSYRDGDRYAVAVDVRTWMSALQALFLALPQAEPLARSILAREFSRWLLLRNAAAVALAARTDALLPAPENEGGLPEWLYVGAVRADLLRPDPALEEQA